MRPRLPTRGFMEIGETYMQGTYPIQMFSCYPNTIFLSRGESDALLLPVLYTTGKFIQRCELIVTGKIGKEYKREYWTYSISVLPKLQLNSVQVFSRKPTFMSLSRANLREKKPGIYTL